MELHNIKISEKSCAALDRLQAFNPGKTRRDILEEVLVKALEPYKGQKKPVEKKPASKKVAKHAKTERSVKKPAKETEKTAKGEKPVHR